MFPIKTDKILITNKDHYMLFDWWNNIHESKIVSFSPVLEVGVIALAIHPDLDKDDENDNFNNFIHFKHISDKLVIYHIYRLIGSNYVLLMKVERNYEAFTFNCYFWNKEILCFSLDSLSDYVDSVTNIHPAIMNYMEFYKDERDRVSTQKNRITHTKEFKNKKKKSRTITTTVYRIHPKPEKVSAIDKRNYQRMTESWLVRGHWRITKNGNKVWVRPYLKGDKSPREPNEYRFK